MEDSAQVRKNASKKELSLYAIMYKTKYYANNLLTDAPVLRL